MAASDHFKTAGTIINRVASEVGLERENDPYSSTDPNFVQLRDLLLSAAGDLLNVRRAAWPQLIKEHTLTTIEGQAAYDVPADFRGMIDQTGWNRTTRWPLVGPATPVEWQKLLAWDSGPTYSVIFRLTPLEIRVHPDPAAGLEIVFEYASRYWVQSVGSDEADADEPDDKDDLVLFDDLLMVRALKLKFLQAKGFDTTVARSEYQDALDAAISRAGGAPVLNLSRPRAVAPMVAASGGFVYR